MAEPTMKDGISTILRQDYLLANLKQPKATWLQNNRKEKLEDVIKGDMHHETKYSNRTSIYSNLHHARQCTNTGPDNRGKGSIRLCRTERCPASGLLPDSFHCT